MSDGAISQAEIDALLSGVDMGGMGSGGFSSSKPSPSEFDTSVLTNFLSEVASTLGSSLQVMTNVGVDVASPQVEVVNREQLLKMLPEMLVAVLVDFSGGLFGDHLVMISSDFAQKLAGLINNEDNPELDDMALSVISEIVSQHTGSEITILGKTNKLPGLASNVAESMHVPKVMVRFPQNDFLLFSYPITSEGVSYTMWEVVSREVANGMISAFGGNVSLGLGTMATEPAQPASPKASPTGFEQPQMVNPMAGMAQMSMGQPMMDMNMGMAQMQMNGMNMAPMGQMNMMNVPNVQSLQYPALQGGVNSMEQGNIGLIMDVYMEMTVELGRTKKQIKEILGMGEGTIIELDKLAGEPVDILVNHKPIAKGEVVVIDENFGVRVTEILSSLERVSDLR